MSILRNVRTRRLLLLSSLILGSLTASPSLAKADIFQQLGNNGTLSVHGTNGEDEITAYYAARSPGSIRSRIKCIVVEVRQRIGGRLIGEAVYPMNKVLALHIDGLAEDDLIDCSAMNIPCIIYGGIGDDDLYGGKNDDEIDGGDGSDDIEGGPGDDILFGGIELPVLLADNIRGDSGKDILIGSPVDGFYVTAQFDVLMGGADEDKYLYCIADWLQDDDQDPIYGFGSWLHYDYVTSSTPYGTKMYVIEQRY